MNVRWIEQNWKSRNSLKVEKFIDSEIKKGEIIQNLIKWRWKYSKRFRKNLRFPENCQILTFRRKVNHIIIARMDSSFILNSRCAWLRFWLEVWISFKIATSDSGIFSIIRRLFELAKRLQKDFKDFQVWCKQSMYQIFLWEPFFFVANMHPMNVQKNKRFLPFLRLHFTVKGAFTHSIKMLVLNLLSNDSPLNA